MNDLLQQTLQQITYSNQATKFIFIFMSNWLIFIIAFITVILLIRNINYLQFSSLVKIVLIGVLSFFATKIITHIILDPRPYIVNHFIPIASIAKDNGFPSDHTLLASIVTSAIYIIDKKNLKYFIISTILIALGRLGIGAHHTMDVLGSMIIVFIISIIIYKLPLPKKLDFTFYNKNSEDYKYPSK